MSEFTYQDMINHKKAMLLENFTTIAYSEMKNIHANHKYLYSEIIDYTIDNYHGYTDNFLHYFCDIIDCDQKEGKLHKSCSHCKMYRVIDNKVKS